MLKMPSCTLSRNEIREKVLESSQFAYDIGDCLRDDLTDRQAAMIAYHIVNRDDAEVGRYVREIFLQRVNRVLEDHIEKYQPTIGDCE